MNNYFGFIQSKVKSLDASSQRILGTQDFLLENGYEVERLIGWGSLGPVMLARKSSTKDQVAIKRFYVETEEQLGNYIRHFQSLSLLKSPYIVTLLGLLSDMNNKYLYLVMEYLTNGNLGEYIKRSNSLSSTQIAGLFIPVIQGLIFLKENNISHGYLKLSNILLNSKGYPILTDFGLVTFITENRLCNEIQKQKSKYYQSSILGQKSQEELPSFETDFGTAGMMIWLLCEKNDISEIFSIQQGILPDISQRTHEDILKVAFEMMMQSPSKDHTPPEAILCELQKLQEHPEKYSMDEEQKQQQLFQIYLKMDKSLSIKFIRSSLSFELENPLTLLSLSLNLEFSSIKGIEDQSLLSPLQNFLNLQSLSANLNYNQIGPNGAKNLLLPLANLINLSSLSLDLKGNSIGSVGAQFFLLPLTNLINLKNLSLDLNSNSIGPKGAESLLIPVSNLTNLQSLQIDLFCNSIEAIGAQSLLLPLTSLFNLSRISLFLFCNKIGDSGSKSLLLPLANLINLSSISIDLNSNLIGDLGAQNLLLPLSNLINLSYIFVDLVYNNIGVIGSKSLLLPLGNKINLETLFINLNNNQTQDIGLVSLLQPLTDISNLQNLIIKASCFVCYKKIKNLCKVLFKKATISIEFRNY